MNYECLIGLEIHIKLNTKSKLFSRSLNSFITKPNKNICEIDLGLPGILPYLNKGVITKAIKLGLALNSKINKISLFDRKNYFYPDLSKGYQITQYNKPIIEGGYIELYSKSINVMIERVQIEEDTASLFHDKFNEFSAIDYNRSGIPLLEVVTFPHVLSSSDAVFFLKILHSIVKIINISDGNLHNGSFRVDVNVSVREKGSNILGNKVEIKNLNSFKFIRKSIDYEFNRQIDLISNGEKINSETRLYNPALNKTLLMRKKEDKYDYKYFPDPDLLPLKIKNNLINKIKNKMNDLPVNIYNHCINTYKLSNSDSLFLSLNIDLYNYFKKVVIYYNYPINVFNFIKKELIKTSDCFSFFKKKIISEEHVARIIYLLNNNFISNESSKIILKKLIENKSNPDEILNSFDLTQVNDLILIKNIVIKELEFNNNAILDYKSGNKKALGFIIGNILKKFKNLNPKSLKHILESLLS